MSDKQDTVILTDDLIQPFQMAEAGVRGRLVRLGKCVDDILNRHDYPEVVARFLGEALVLSAVLGGALKFEGIFTVQTKSDGAITMLASDMTTPGHLRGYAAFDPDKLAVAEGVPSTDLVKQYLGKGYIAFTIDAKDTDQRYQGIVALEGESLSQCMEDYFDKSEQLETKLISSVEKRDGKWRAGGLMIQRLPNEDGRIFNQDAHDEAWRNAEALVSTVQSEELTDRNMRSPELLYRLFHEDGVWLHDPQILQDKCSCSEERFFRTLQTFGATEVEDLADDGVIKTDCQFCSAQYVFKVSDIVGADQGS
ncbi:Hsp33 family molecular chaperone HslO [Sneathiella sp.]|jgi:molecular chaperone Hsp33|uniref:Hsp33 family molecular chaperone HslO n=1 Tax=Sneathiella sp. TaxID=1964365 RepID=UPI0039E2311A